MMNQIIVQIRLEGQKTFNLIDEDIHTKWGKRKTNITKTAKEIFGIMKVKINERKGK